MNVKIQSIHFDADEKLIEFVENRVNKLVQFFDHIVSSEVYLKVDKAESRDNKIVEIKMGIPGKELFASKQGDSFEEATDEAVEAIRRQIVKFKGKLLTKH